MGWRDEKGKTFGPPPSDEVLWVVTHKITGDKLERVAQTSFQAVRLTPWGYSEVLTERVQCGTEVIAERKRAQLEQIAKLTAPPVDSDE